MFIYLLLLLFVEDNVSDTDLREMICNFTSIPELNELSLSSIYINIILYFVRKLFIRKKY